MMAHLNRYVILIAALLLHLSCAKKKEKTFSFIQLCDTQLGMGGYEHDIATFKQAVIQINELDPDFVVLCGDLVDEANNRSYVDFKNIMKGFEMPCHLAPGNHDVGNKPTSKTLEYYRETIGKDYYEFEHKGYAFTVTNTQLWKIDVADESKKQDSWFKKTLATQKAKQLPILVIGHYPLYTEYPDEEEHYFNFPISKRQELLSLFTKNNVVAYLSGHTHKLVINSYENIQLVSGETTSKNFDNRPFGFRRWQVSSDSITHHFVPVQPARVSQDSTLKN